MDRLNENSTLQDVIKAVNFLIDTKVKENEAEIERLKHQIKYNKMMEKINDALRCL